MFYVSVIDGGRKALALGPFATHAEALDRVEDVHEFCLGRWPDEAHWWAYGTARVRVGRPAGKLNAQLGITEVAA